MALAQKLSVCRDISLIIASSTDSKFWEKTVNYILKVGYVLLQVKLHEY